MGEPLHDAADIRSFIRPDKDGIYHIAVFDFDGTCIRGNSPVMLVRYLTFHRMLKPSVVSRILAWAFAYKTHLPQSETWVRSLVFRAFMGKPVSEVDKFLMEFAANRVDARFRPEADATMQSHVEAGHVVLCVSATFEPILRQIMQRHPIQYQVSTRMRIDEAGCYTNEVDGLPVEGPEKLRALARFADEHFGKDKWVLEWAYGDHYSDKTLLSAAKQAFAVRPDSTLTRVAKREGWPILEWAEPKASENVDSDLSDTE